MSFITKISLHLCVLGALAISTALAASAEKKPATPDQIAVESKRANEFFDQKFDEYVARHPQMASQLGLKIGYDKWLREKAKQGSAPSSTSASSTTSS